MTAILEKEATNAPVLRCRCDERNGVFTRSVYEMVLSPENLQRFWNECKKFPTLYGHILTIEQFAELFIDELPDGTLRAKGLFWVVDDFIGVFYITNIYPGVDATCHFAFFDGALNGRETLVRKVLEYGFKEYSFHRLSVELPAYAKSSSGFVEKIGFRIEGRKKSARKYKGEWFDVNLYGMINPFEGLTT